MLSKAVCCPSYGLYWGKAIAWVFMGLGSVMYGRTYRRGVVIRVYNKVLIANQIISLFKLRLV